MWYKLEVHRRGFFGLCRLHFESDLLAIAVEFKFDCSLLTSGFLDCFLKGLEILGLFTIDGNDDVPFLDTSLGSR